MFGDYPDYRGVPITGASALISDMGWTVIAERDVSEAFAPLTTLRLELLALGLAVIPAVIGLGFVLHRDIIRPMRDIIAADQRVLAGGAFLGVIPESSMPANEWARVMTVRNDMLRRLGQDQAWHEAEAGRQERESQRLADIVRAITAHDPLDRILQCAAETARELCGTDSAAIQLDTAGLPGLPAVFTARAPRMRDDAASGEHVRVRLMEPISIGDRRAGALVVLKQGTGEFSDVDRVTLTRVVRHVAVAVDNARFHRGLIDAAERKDHFLATLAHELRNPLSAILHALQALDRLGADDAEATRFRDIIRRQVGHVTRLVSDLLDVSRIAVGKLRLQREAVDLKTIVTDAVEAMKHRDRMIEWAVPATAVVVHGDATRLDQVVKNLLDNAIKYSAPHSSISVRVWSEADDAFFVVQDHGIGIAPEQIPRVFDAYMQVDAALQHAHGGLGLGLSLVRGIVEAHGGAITLDSDGVGKGTRVTIRLPLMV